MQLTSTVSRCLTAGALAAALLAGGGAAVAAPARPSGPAPAPVAMASHGPYARLHALADLSAQRLATADLVAAAKYGTDSPIDDPAREKQVLDAVAAQAREIGADPEATVRIFRDQIEANKVVQRGLFRRWDADPSQAPTERPDLAEVRKEINRINGELVRGIAASPDARTAPYCGGVLTAAAVHVRHENRLDALHAAALGRALGSVCASRPQPQV
ncbi:chorismate mutase [Streptomyces formicae]|uniref:chorismate mutase n=1 Tax=Streptomyces formicae TaxID=1616117 RepID=A0A291QMI0_9ACTN|nr:chorismate mutase [Streptomyces formicae]ATL32694.1 Periplasmic chorismate mutase I precursor [Streptomyces formicae]